MKSRYWVAMLAVLVAVCAGLSVFLLRPTEDAQWAEIRSDGEIIATVDLRIDRVLRVQGPNGGENVVAVEGGKVAVIEANCPDQHCMQRGFCGGGAAIVCLPNRLVITFLDAEAVDGVVQ